MIVLFKKRNFSDYLNDTFSFFKNDGKHFLKNYFVINGIFLLILTVFIYFLSKIYFEVVFSSIENSTPGTYDFMDDLFNDNLGLFIGAIIGFVVLSIFLSLLNFAYPIIYLKKYEENKGSNFATKEIISGLKSKAGRIFMFFLISLFIMTPLFMIFFLISILLSFIIIGIPLLIISIPALFSLMSLAFYEYLNTDNGYFSSVGNALGYLKKQFWPIVGVTMIMYMIAQAILTILSMIPYVISMVILFTSIDEGTKNATTDAFSIIGVVMSVLFIIVIIANYVINNLLLINQGMIYYSRREHNENQTSFGEIDSIGTHLE